jgi:site-specific recombinase XerC
MWVIRWKYEMTAKALRPGIWALKDGGYFMRTRVLDPRTGKFVEYQRVLRDVTLNEAERARYRLRCDAWDLVNGRKQTPMLWSTYAASLFEAKVNEGRIKSAKGREKWATTLARLIPQLGHLYVDEIRHAHLVAWRNDVAKWMRVGMPSIRKSDVGKKKLVHLAPATANGWIAILKVICRAMTLHFELDRDPAAPLPYFPLPRIYTREQPNALTDKQTSDFLAKMRKLHPHHYAMTFLGFAIGARPSSLRPLRRKGPNADVLWDEGVLLLRRSHALGKEIMDQTKTGRDQEIPLTSAVLWALREHVASLDGKMAESEYLFPSTTGGLRSRSALDKPFRDVTKALGWELHITPRAMRRTFQDLARHALIHDVVTRAISGHATERMQRHYSTAEREEMRSAVDRIVSLITTDQSGPKDDAPKPAT